MSQVDDWSDGYTSDYLRDLNTYGPASANVPRPSVVSHQVRYRAPDTSDIPLAPGQNPEGSVYSNASGARMGQTKPASGYRAPAGGGWDVNSSDTNLRFSNESGGKQYRVSRTQTAKKTVKKQAQPDKKQAQPDKKQAQDESNVAERAASHRQSDFDWGELNGQALDAAARFLPALRLLSGFGVGAGSVDTESSSTEGQFKNMPWYEDAKAHHEAVKKNMDDYGSALGTLKSTWDDIPWWTKLVMLPPVFKAGSPAAGASTTGNVWAEGSRAAAGDATAGAKAFEEALSRMNGGAVRGAPVEGAARRSFSSAGIAGSKTGGTAAGESTGARSFGFDLTPEQAARARTTHDAYISGVAGRGAAAGAESAAGAGRAATGAESASARSFGFDVSPVEAAAARSSHDAYVQNMAELTSALRRAGMPEAEIQSYIARSGLANNPEALQQAVFTIRRRGYSGLFEHSADEAAAAGAGTAREAMGGSIRNPDYGKSPLEIWQQERAATEAANAKFRDMFGFSDVAKLAEAGNVGRGAAAAGGQAAGREATTAGEQVAFNKIPEELRAEISARRKALTAANIKPSDILNEISEAMDTGYLSGTTYEVGRKLLQAVQAGGGEALSAGERSIAEAYSKFLQTPKGRMYREDMNW